MIAVKNLNSEMKDSPASSIGTIQRDKPPSPINNGDAENDERERKSKSPIHSGSTTPPTRGIDNSGSFSAMGVVCPAPKDLHMFPEVMNESSSGSLHLSDSAAFRQGQMIQAFASERRHSAPLEDPEDQLAVNSHFEATTRHDMPTSSSTDAAVLASNAKLDVGGERPLIHDIDETSGENSDTVNDDTDTDTEFSLQSYTSPVKRNSLERLKELPQYYGGTTTPSPHNGRANRKASYNNRHATNSSTSLASGLSRISFTSMTGHNSLTSMPSLSSIFEHDLMSVGTNGTGGNSTVYTTSPSIGTNMTGSGDPPSISGATGANEHSIILSLMPPAEESKFGSPCSSSSNSSSNTNTNNQRWMTHSFSDQASSAVPPSFFHGAASPTVTTPNYHRELSHLAGTTLDILGPNIENPHKNLPQRRWESDAPAKKAPPTASGDGGAPFESSKIPHGNPEVAPLTHAQKLLLPNRRSDVQPIYVARRGSDASLAAPISLSADPQEAAGLGSPAERCPVPRTRSALQTAFVHQNQHLFPPSSTGNNDTLPTYTRRMSSSSNMTYAMESASLLDFSMRSPEVNPVMLQLPKRDTSSAAAAATSSGINKQHTPLL